MMHTKKYEDNAATTAVLIEAGFAMMRENIRRRCADASETQVDALLGAWMRRESDSLPGDTAGNVRIRHRNT